MVSTGFNEDVQTFCLLSRKDELWQDSLCLMVVCEVVIVVKGAHWRDQLCPECNKVYTVKQTSVLGINTTCRI